MLMEMTIVTSVKFSVKKFKIQFNFNASHMCELRQLPLRLMQAVLTIKLTRFEIYSFVRKCLKFNNCIFNKKPSRK